jgi:hypothetical protein
MAYAIYDNKKKKFPYTDDAEYRSEKSAKKDIVELISNEVNYGDINKAIYYFENLVPKIAPVKKAPVKKAPVKKAPAQPVKRFGRPKKK